MGGNLLRTQFRQFARFAVRHPTVAGFGLLIAATLLLHLGWGWSTARTLASQNAAIAAVGLPVGPGDLTIADVPPDDDAWPLIRKAVSLDNRMSPSNSNFSYPQSPPFGPAWEQSASASETANAGVFAIAREMRTRSRIKIRDAWPSPLINAAFTSYTNARQIANTVGDGALLLHVRGNDREAVERLLDLMHLADLVQQDETLVGQLVATGLGAMACARVMVVAPELAVEDAEVRRNVSLLIDQLLGESPKSVHFRNAFAFERVFGIDFYNLIAKDVKMLRPLAEQEMARHNARQEVIRQAALARTAPAAMRILQQIPEPPKKVDPALARTMGQVVRPEDLPRYSRWFAPSYDVSLRQVFVQHFRSLAERRMTAIALAIRLYRVDNAGRWPARLDELTPKYLPAIPADPFHEDGRQVGYVVLKGGLPNGGDRPLLFVDAGDVIDGAIDAEPMIGWQQDPKGRDPRVEVRQYRDLARWAPQVRRIDKIMQDEAAEELRK